MAAQPQIVLRTFANSFHVENVIPYEKAELAKVDAELRLVQCNTPDDILAAGRDARAIIHPSNVLVPRRIIERLEMCKGIVVTKVGTDNVDVAAATACGIMVANLPDGWTDEVADHALALLLALNRRLVSANKMLKDQGWDAARNAVPPMLPLRQMTLGIVGFGHIGRATAGRARSFGMSVIAYDPLVESQVFAAHNVEQVELEDLLRRSDAVSLHADLTDRTRGMINERTLRLMQPHAVLVNTARGPIVDEAALVRALREGWIAGAGVDVFAQEPLPSGNPLLALDNAVVQPHIAGVSTMARELQRVKPIGDVVRMLSGRPPRPEAFVNPEVWTKTTVRE